MPHDAFTSRLQPPPIEQPHDTPTTIACLDAEQAVVGAALLESDAVDRARVVVTPSDFAWPAFGEIFAAACALRDREESIDPLTLATELERRGTLEGVGGKPMIGFLIDAVPSAANVVFHARIITDRARRRGMQELGLRLIEQAEVAETDLQALAQDASGALLPLATDTGRAGRGYRPVRDVLWPVMEQIEARARSVSAGNPASADGVPAGIPELDALIPGGWRAGELVVFAARPKNGKSTIVSQIAVNNALGDVPGGRARAVGLVSTEMTREELAAGFLSNVARVPRTRLDAGTVRDDDWPRLARASGTLAAAPIYVDDEAFPSLTDVIARATKLKQDHPEIELLCVDYLQRVTNPMKGRRGDEENNAVSAGLKQLAKRLGIPVLCPAQVNFKETDREHRKPEPRDVQNCSGAVQDANFFFVLHRDAMAPEWLEVHLDECRRAPKGRCTLGWDGAHMRIFSPGESVRVEPAPAYQRTGGVAPAPGRAFRDWTDDIVGGAA